MIVNKKVETFDKDYIANNFNTYFTQVRVNLAKDIPLSTTSFKMYLTEFSSSIETEILSNDKFEMAFKSLKADKSPDYDGISSNIVKHTYEEIKTSPEAHF